SVVWKPCGTGCERMNPTLVPGQSGWKAYLGSDYTGSRVLLSLYHSVGPQDSYGVFRVIDLRDGATLAAIRAGPEYLEYAACHMSSSSYDPTILEASASPDFDTTSVMYGRAQLEGGGYT